MLPLFRSFQLICLICLGISLLIHIKKIEFESRILTYLILIFSGAISAISCYLSLRGFGLFPIIGFLCMVYEIFVLIRFITGNVNNSNYLISDIETISQPNEEVSSNIIKIFVDTTEKYVSSLGNNYIINYISSGNISSGFAVISNKRVYFRGDCYYKEFGRLKKSYEERTVDLKDVTGTGFSSKNPVGLLFAGIITGLISIVSMFVGEVFFILVLLTISLLTGYFMKRKTLFEIDFSGGKICFDVNIYGRSEVNDFQKQLRRAKDSYLKNREKEMSRFSNIINEGSLEKSSQAITKENKADEIRKYAELFQNGFITQEEFEKLKKEIITSKGTTCTGY